MSDLDVLLLRFDAPMMSFGGVRVDELNPTEDAPGTSLLAGICGNALGYDHRHHDLMERLQARLRHASRRDRTGRRVVDYHTVDLSQDFLIEGWTTRNVPAGRAGAKKTKMGNHIRYRHYLADAAVTVALTLDPADEHPVLDDLSRALHEPARPLFIGRKCCLPSTPLVAGRCRAASLREALERAPLTPATRPEGDDVRLWNRSEPSADGSFPAWWPGDGPAASPGEGQRTPIVDERDWVNQIHVGRRFVWRGRVRIARHVDE